MGKSKSSKRHFMDDSSSFMGRYKKVRKAPVRGQKVIRERGDNEKWNWRQDFHAEEEGDIE